MKLKLLSLLLLGNQALYAGTMASTSHHLANDDSSRWSLGGKAIYLQPSLNDLRFANRQTITTVDDASSTWKNNLQYSWGFFLEGSYHYQQNNDINLNWYHLRNEHHFHEINLSGSITTKDIKPQWDGVNLEFGKTIKMDDDKNIRIHAGVQYANLGSELWVINSVSTRDGVNLLPPQSFSGSPSYNGFGPRFGSDFSVNNFLPVRIYANLAGAILAGTSHHNKQFNYPEYGTASSGNGANMHVVPELDAKLGGTYQYQTPNGQLVLDAGWMFVNYWNALVTISPSDLSTVFTTNIAFQGPYVGLKWIGG